MFNLLIILIAVINLTNSQETPEVDNVAILSGLSSSNLDCSLKFDRDFLSGNEEVANALAQFLIREESPRENGREGSDSGENGSHSVRGPSDNRGPPRPDSDSTREPCEGEDCRRGRGPREDDSTREPCEGEDCRRGRGPREDDSTREPCEGEDCRRGREHESRGPREHGESRPRGNDQRPRPDSDSTRVPCEGEDCRRGRGPRGGRRFLQRGRQGGVTEDVARESHSEDNSPSRGRGGVTEDVAESEGSRPSRGQGRGGVTEDVAESENSRPSRGRGRGGVTEDVAESENSRPSRGRGRGDVSETESEDRQGLEQEDRPSRGREAGGERDEDCECRERRRRERDDETSTEDDESEPLLRRLLRGSGRPTRDEDSTRETRPTREEDSPREPRPTRDEDSTREPCECEGRGRGRGKLDDSDSESVEDTEAPRRELQRQNGGRRKRSIDATISDGTLEFAGVALGQVVFGEVDADLESRPLTVTIGETIFSCDVEVQRRGKKVSCRGTDPEDNHKVHLGCAIQTEDEQ